MEVAIMIEGQNGVNWQRWKRIVKLVEEVGFVGLFRSDHFTNEAPPDLDSLELWVSLTWLASNTQQIEFGPLVTPISFRDPIFTARIALAVDDLSGGRLRLGLGAGWQEREHHLFGYNLLGIEDRFSRFREGLDVITHLLRGSKPVSYHGSYYSLNGAQLLPKSKRADNLPIIIGGNSTKYTLPLVARYADEWNCKFLNPGQFKIRNSKLDNLIRKENRDPKAIKRSMMTSLIYGYNQSDVNAKLGQYSFDEHRKKGSVVGTIDQIVEQLKDYNKAGLQRIILQWLDMENLKELSVFGKSILPEVQKKVSFFS